MSRLRRSMCLHFLMCSAWCLSGQAWAQSTTPPNDPVRPTQAPAQSASPQRGPMPVQKSQVTSPTKASANTEQRASSPSQPLRRFTGRPGELEPSEEERIEAIIERFIQHDLGIRPDPQAIAEFDRLGVEAIPALVRALNRTAPLAQRCPPAMIAKKLTSLMHRVDEVEVLDFIRRDVGAGIRSGPNTGILDGVRYNALLRKRQLLSQPQTPSKSLFPAPSQDKPARSLGEKP